MNLFKTIWKGLFISLLAMVTLVIIGAGLTYFFKDKIINSAVNEINKYLLTKIEVDPNIEVSIFNSFPEVSLEFKNIKVYENLPKNSSTKLAEASRLYVSFNTWDLINNKYSLQEVYIEDGYLNIKIDSTGTRNYDIIRANSDSKNEAFEFKLEKVLLHHFKLQYFNSLTHQRHTLELLNAAAKLSLMNHVYNIDIESAVWVNSIIVQNSKYFKEKNVYIKTNIKYYTNTDRLEILPSDLKLDNTNFAIKGDFALEGRKKISLSIDAQNANIYTLLSILPDEIIKEFAGYESKGKVYCHIKVNGIVSNKETPHIEVSFGSSNASLLHDSLPYSIKNINLKGYFSNGTAHKSRTSFLELKDIQCRVDNKIFKGELIYRNFSDPNVKLALLGELDTKLLKRFITIDEIQSLDGVIDFDVLCEGRISDLKKKETAVNVKAEGNIALKSVSLKLFRYQLPFQQLSGAVHFDNNDISVKSLSGKIGSTDFTINGYFKNLLSRVFYPQQPYSLVGEVISKNINVDEIIKLNNNPTPVEKVNHSEDKAEKENYNLLVNLKVENLNYERYRLKLIEGKLGANPDGFSLRNINFLMAGGETNLDLDAEYMPEGKIYFKAFSKTSGTLIDSLFYISKNFNQDFITSQHLKGELTASVNSYFILDKNQNINLPSLKADVEASIINGELKDFSPMKSLSRFIEEEKLERIMFSELKNKIYVDNSIITIPEMEIRSNISNISISGTHTFTNEMDYKLTVPLKNFKKEKRDKDEGFGAVEVDEKGNSNVFLTIKGNSENYKVAYDTRKTKRKIRNDLRKEGIELREIFRNKKMKEAPAPMNKEPEFFDFD